MICKPHLILCYFSEVSSGGSCISLCPGEPLTLTSLFPHLLSGYSRRLGEELVLSRCLCTLYKRTPGSSRYTRTSIALALPTYHFFSVGSKPLPVVLVQSAAVGFSCRWQTWQPSPTPWYQGYTLSALLTHGSQVLDSFFLFSFLNYILHSGKPDVIWVCSDNKAGYVTVIFKC